MVSLQLNIRIHQNIFLISIKRFNSFIDETKSNKKTLASNKDMLNIQIDGREGQTRNLKDLNSVTNLRDQNYNSTFLLCKNSTANRVDIFLAQFIMVLLFTYNFGYF